MTAHRYHPDPDRDDDPRAILWDDCGRCDQQAANPLAGLDDVKIRALWERVRTVELDSRSDFYASVNESRAASVLYNMYALASRASTLVGEIQAVADQRSTYRDCDACGVSVSRWTWSAHLVTQSHLAAVERSYNVPPMSKHWTLVKDDGTTLPVRFESIESAESSADLMRDRTGRTWTVQEVAL